jgi:hypothetical protein
MKVRHSLRFSAVADSVLEAANLSFGARVVLAWALGRQDGFECWIWYMLKTLGLTDRTWPRVRRELVEAGFFYQTREKGDDGKFVWRNEFTDYPLLHGYGAGEGGTGSNSKSVEHGKKTRPSKPETKPEQSSQQSKEEEIPVWLSRVLKIERGNSQDAANAKAIGVYPRDQIEVAAAAAREEEASGIAYPTRVLKLLRAAHPNPKPKPLSEWAIAAEVARRSPPKGMNTHSTSAKAA